jgi:hypothetical protein
LDNPAFRVDDEEFSGSDFSGLLADDCNFDISSNERRNKLVRMFLTKRRGVNFKELNIPYKFRVLQYLCNSNI